MSNKKYEFTEETIEVFCHTLHRIRALINIPRYNVSKGDLGGFIEKEENLSHGGDCWVSEYAQVFGNARVFGDTLVSGNAQVFGNVQAFGTSQVYGNARVFGDTRVSGNARVFGDTRVSGNAQVFGNARVFKNAWVFENARVSGYAMITKTSDVLVIGPIGSREDYTTFYRSDNGIMVSCGCFNNTIEEFEKAVKETHGDNIHAKNYLALCEIAKRQILEEG